MINRRFLVLLFFVIIQTKGLSQGRTTVHYKVSIPHRVSLMLEETQGKSANGHTQVQDRAYKPIGSCSKFDLEILALK